MWESPEMVRGEDEKGVGEMKKLCIIVLLSIMLIGCSSIRFNPGTGEVSYMRIGDQHIKGLEIRRTAEGAIRMKLEGQYSEADALTEAIKVISTLTVAVP